MIGFQKFLFTVIIKGVCTYLFLKISVLTDYVYKKR